MRTRGSWVIPAIVSLKILKLLKKLPYSNKINRIMLRQQVNDNRDKKADMRKGYAKL